MKLKLILLKSLNNVIFIIIIIIVEFLRPPEDLWLETRDLQLETTHLTTYIVDPLATPINHLFVNPFWEFGQIPKSKAQEHIR